MISPCISSTALNASCTQTSYYSNNLSKPILQAATLVYLYPIINYGVGYIIIIMAIFYQRIQESYCNLTGHLIKPQENLTVHLLKPQENLTVHLLKPQELP